jgi:hypothetical protein
MAASVFWPAAAAAGEPEGLLDRVRSRMRERLGQLPDYVCHQEVERFSRNSSEKPWEKVDALRLEVALVGKKEMYARPGAGQFDERPLAEMIGKGTVSTGQFAALAQQVFLGVGVTFTYRGESERTGKRAHEFDYDVPPDRSTYRLRTGGGESVVGFQGAFWVDAESEELSRLEVQAYDIPEPLGLAEANSQLSYARQRIGGQEVLLPVAATLAVVGSDGLENLNRIHLTGCRQFQTESRVKFAAAEVKEEPDTAPVSAPLAAAAAPDGAVLELALESSVDLAKQAIGDAVRAVVAKPAKTSDRTIAPQGAVVLGRLVRLQKETRPFPMYEVGIEIEAIEMNGQAVPVSATMIDAGPAAGLLRQAKRLDPTFTRKATNSMNVLVREVQKGQGILLWDARRGPLPRGLKMKWRVDDPGGTVQAEVRKAAQ